MIQLNFSEVEKCYFEKSGLNNISTKIPYISVDNFPILGLITSLRFLEWVSENPEGIISLPTGKTPEYFINWTKYILDNWDHHIVRKIRTDNGLKMDKKPDLSKLGFVQIDEFYPINSEQHNSFYHYVRNYYIRGFGLDENRALLINSDQIPLVDNKHFSEVFQDCKVDLSLRYRDAKTKKEKEQQDSIFMIDNWCEDYEQRIREKGGIGFFLGGIGPDGHIAFNTKGSSHFSTTRLTQTNFETQAQAAGDLGGIEISKNRLVITIGLETITYNRNAVAIIFAAGEAKSGVVKNALENNPSVLFPATVLQRLPKSRFYLTKSAGILLNDSVESYYKKGNWTKEKTESSIINLCKKIEKFGNKLELNDLLSDTYCQLIPDLSLETVKKVIFSMENKIQRGIRQEKNQVFYHTGPHHDDIQLGIQPLVNQLLNDSSNVSYFSVLTSGFTAVTNAFIIDTLNKTLNLLDDGKIQMVNFPDFFQTGFHQKWDKDVYHFLINLASSEMTERVRGLCHRIVRAIVSIWEIADIDQLKKKIQIILSDLRESYDGQKNSPEIQMLKGRIREFEEELVWAHAGVQVKNVHHLRLGFYTGDIFTKQPSKERDVLPVLEELRKYKPTVISLALDPEGSGPDTHYKVLQVIAEAVRWWGKETDLQNLRIWGYRNVWYKFQPSDVNMIVPVSINSMDVLDKSFSDCYLSQVNASFPSHELDGKFSELSKKIWVEQLNSLQYLMGKDYFYENEVQMIRASHGLIFLKEMTVPEFLEHACELEKAIEGID